MTAAVNVARRYHAAQGTKVAAVALRDVGGHDWGWLVDDERRMHLVSLPRRGRSLARVKVLLEVVGRRFFKVVEGHLTSTQVDELQAVLDDQRTHVEDAWVTYMVGRGWVDVDLDDELLTLNVNAGAANEYRRRGCLSGRAHGTVEQVRWEGELVVVQYDNGAFLSVDVPLLLYGERWWLFDFDLKGWLRSRAGRPRN